MWEYKMAFFKYRLFSDLTEELNKYGAENWDIVLYREEKPEKYGCEYEVKVLFKRPKEKPA
jgi:hypothetical protein